MDRANHASFAVSLLESLLPCESNPGTMSVKFQKETVRATAPAVKSAGETAHKISEALTGGKDQTGYLAVSCAVAHNLVESMGLTQKP